MSEPSPEARPRSRAVARERLFGEAAEPGADPERQPKPRRSLDVLLAQKAQRQQKLHDRMFPPTPEEPEEPE
jgi:hypothetical protein